MLGKEKISRISVSVSSNLLRRFDDYTKRLKYENRSKAMQDAMQSFITESKWLCEQMGQGTGAIVLVYDHRVKGLEEDLTDIQHYFGKIICSSMHVHLDTDNCLEIIAIRGKSEDVRNLAQEFKARKGVKQVRFAIVTP